MWWLVILAIGLFMVVSVLPCCKGKEILWIFVGWGICAVPVNIHLLYDHLDYIGCFVDEWDAIFLPLLMIIFVVMEVAEEMIVLAIGRMVWPEQDEMFLNFVEEEDMDEKTVAEGTEDKETVDKETEDEEEKEVEEEKAEANSEPEPGLKSYYLGRYLISDGMDPVQLKVEAPIEWIPLAVEGNQALLFSKHCIKWDLWDTKLSSWTESFLKKTVDKLYEECFSEEEQEIIIEQPEGKLYPLSRAEIEKYFPTKKSRRAVIEMVDRGDDDITKITLEPIPYWLRDENKAVDEFGNIYEYDEEDCDADETGIRLAMRVNII